MDGTPAAALRIYTAMVYMAVSPDGIDPNEDRVLKQYADARGIDAEVRARLRAQITKDQLQPPESEGEQTAMIAALIEIIAADGCLDHDEQDRLLTVAQDLSIPAEVVRPQLLERLMGG